MILMGIISTAAITWWVTYTICRMGYTERQARLRRSAEYLVCNYLIEAGGCSDPECWAARYWPKFTWRHDDYRTLGEALDEFKQELDY